MRIFVAGATGAVGRRLLPLLVGGGHRVVATTTRPGRLSALRAAGADAVVMDGLDREAVVQAVVSARPDVVVHEMTALASLRSLKNFDREFALTNRLRTEGTDNLLAGARRAGARRFVAQSYTGWTYPRGGARIQSEKDPFEPDPPGTMAGTLDAIRRLEAAVAGAPPIEGVVLRYGSLYGPGTSIAIGGDVVELLRKRRLPIVGDGAGIWSFVHVDDAAEATRLAIENGPAGVFNVVDDEPIEAAEWIPELARAIGAAPPRRVPAWLGRLFIGEAGVFLMTQARGASNGRAKAALRWRPAYPTWRDGFRRGLAGEPPRRLSASA
jgi:nucleoside-diphosphate-sugar epimerase